MKEGRHFILRIAASIRIKVTLFGRNKVIMSPPSSTTSYPSHESESPVDSEKQFASEKDMERSGATFAPISNPTANEGRQRSNTSKSLERSWSLNDGVSIGANDPDGTEADKAGKETKDDSAYTVAWDENDPMNPRNMNKARRWLAVLIVSVGSICV